MKVNSAVIYACFLFENLSFALGHTLDQTGITLSILNHTVFEKTFPSVEHLSQAK